ncbi:hypothetical protein EYF80_030778 [Liparis tanakae]|uniref:Uncharacterized protein n=1 Tax=Liparis tanakae TaxID=230148 RepID=A0A4Z2H0P7_9TELE|nr:hypothetical protein EYF80_030778 [Liparis tanakae]
MRTLLGAGEEEQVLGELRAPPSPVSRHQNRGVRVPLFRRCSVRFFFCALNESRTRCCSDACREETQRHPGPGVTL